MWSEWTKKKISEIANIVGGGTPSTKDPENFNGEIPWLTPKDLSGYSFRYISHGERNISQKGYDSSNAKFVPKGSVLLTTRAPVGYVAIASNPLTTNQGFHTLVLKDGYHSEFVYYLLKGNTDYLRAHATGTTYGELSGSILGRLTFVFPPLPEQRAIAHILGTLDDKIELNRRMNETLEEMARALFKSWFVDFDPVRAKAAVRREHPEWSNAQVSRTACPTLKPEIAELFPDEFENSELGEIPKGWKVGKFGDCCTVKGGYAYKSKDFTDEGFPLLRIKNINSDYTVDLYDVVYMPEEIALKTKDFWLDDGDLVMAMTGATIGKFGLIANRYDAPNALLNQRVAKLLPKIESLREPWFQFISLLVTDVYEQIVNIGGGSAQPNISSSQIESCQFIVPDDNSIIQFTDIIDPFMRKWLLNLKEKQTLASLRDTLLPKLISGELRMKDAEKFLKERGI